MIHPKSAVVKYLLEFHEHGGCDNLVLLLLTNLCYETFHEILNGSKWTEKGW